MFDKRLVKNFDYIILISIILLVGFGLLAIGIAMRSPVEDSDGALSKAIGSFNLHQVKLQLINFITGLILMLIVICIDYRIINNLSIYAYIAVIGLLVLVIFAGHTAGGAQSWIAFGPFRMQPSEFAKISVILILAKIMAKSGEEGINNFKTLSLIAIAIAIPFALIMMQPDLGTALTFIVILFGMLFVAGIDYRLLFAGVGLMLIAIPIAWFFVLDEYQQFRLLVFLNPGMDPLGKGYSVLQSMMSIGSGQLYGQIGSGEGLLSVNTLSQLNFLPAKETDFIFSVTVEALGFVGGIIVIILYYILIMRTIRIAANSRDKLATYIATGVASMMLFHIFENIGMTIGIMPITGIPLPFISYGGSSMWTNMIAFGLVLNIGMRKHKIKF